MWYIEIGTKKDPVTVLVSSFKPSYKFFGGKRNGFTIVDYNSNGYRLTIELPFNYHGFKNILLAAQKEGMIADFKEDNWPVLKAALESDGRGNKTRLSRDFSPSHP